MNVSAVNCTPIKPKVSFGRVDIDDPEQTRKFTDNVYDNYVNSKNIKKPLAALGSVLLAGLLSYATGKMIASKSSAIFEAVKGFIKADSKTTLPELFEKGLKKGSQILKNTSKKLATDDISNISKVKNFASKAISGTEKIARTAYKKVAYSNIPVETSLAEKSAKAFGRLAGLASVSTIFPSLLKKDVNNDGVSDILQRGQNAYTGSQTKFNSVVEKASKFSNLVDLLT